MYLECNVSFLNKSNCHEFNLIQLNEEHLEIAFRLFINKLLIHLSFGLNVCVQYLKVLQLYCCILLSIINKYLKYHKKHDKFTLNH